MERRGPHCKVCECNLRIRRFALRPRGGGFLEPRALGMTDRQEFMNTHFPVGQGPTRDGGVFSAGAIFRCGLALNFAMLLRRKRSLLVYQPDGQCVYPTEIL